MKNIRLAYLIAFCNYSWFWLGIWVFYYLRFTDYAGIGLLETVLIVTMTLAEIPTGALADLLGKKKTLIFSLFFQTTGELLMALTPNFLGLAISVFLGALGGTLYSGTFEALIYDSLKQNNQESKYDRVISKLNSIKLIAPALCGVVGGFLYTLSPQLPLLAAAAFCFVGLIGTFFLIEPIIDTDKFSWRNYLNQTKQGFKQLSQTKPILNQTILLLSIGVIGVILDEMLFGFLGVEFGLKPDSIGVVWSAIFLVSAAALQSTPTIRRLLGDNKSLLLTGGVIATSLIVSPILGLILGVITIFISSTSLAIFTNLTSIIINRHTESKYRATTISTFNMVKNIPYVFTAYFIGSLSDSVSAKTTALILGLILMLLLIIQVFFSFNSRVSHALEKDN